jgi:hypothetical protein
MDACAANDRIADKALQLRFVSRAPMLCECSAPSCRTIVMISLREYREIRANPGHFLTAPGHHLGGTTLERETREYAVRTLRDLRDGDRRSA